MKIVYLDNAATTKMSDKVINEMTKSFSENYGNPSSVHTLGQRAKSAVENARHIVAKNLKVETTEIVFTSGGAEGNNLVIRGFLKANKDKGKHIITSKIEHSTILKTFEQLEKEGYEVSYIGVNENGVVDIKELKRELREDTALVSIMFVNNENGVIQNAIRYIKKKYPEFLIIGDVCCCEYTSHGHCGILDEKGNVKNDETLEVLSKIALSYAKAGVDIVAPSDMMDGRVRKISEVLSENGFNNIPIMCYSVKYSSSFYGPFREAAGSAPKFGDRKSYQMDFRYSGDALSEVEADLMQGADMVIIKPAMAYLDILYKIKGNFGVPVIAYSVSGEYSMIRAAAINGWIDEKSIVMEQMYAFKRAGANAVITYFAKDVARYLDEG